VAACDVVVIALHLRSGGYSFSPNDTRQVVNTRPVLIRLIDDTAWLIRSGTALAMHHRPGGIMLTCWLSSLR